MRAKFVDNSQAFSFVLKCTLSALFCDTQLCLQAQALLQYCKKNVVIWKT